MNEQSIVMRWQNAEHAAKDLGLKIEISTDMYRVVNDTNPVFAHGANWSFGTLDGLIGWCNGIHLGRQMK